MVLAVRTLHGLALVERMPPFLGGDELRLALAGTGAGADRVLLVAEHDARGEHLRVFRSGDRHLVAGLAESHVVRLDRQRGLPIERRPFRGDLGQCVVHQMMHDLAGLLDAVLDERRADQRFDDVAQDRAFVGSTLFGLAVAKQDVRSDVQLLAGDLAQRLLGDGLGAHLGELAFVHIRMDAVQRFRGDEFQHRVPEELEAFVVLRARVLVGEGTVGERLDQQFGRERGAERLQQHVGGHFALFGDGCADPPLVGVAARDGCGFVAGNRAAGGRGIVLIGVLAHMVLACAAFAANVIIGCCARGKTPAYPAALLREQRMRPILGTGHLRL